MAGKKVPVFYVSLDRREQQRRAIGAAVDQNERGAIKAVAPLCDEHTRFFAGFGDGGRCEECGGFLRCQGFHESGSGWWLERATRFANKRFIRFLPLILAESANRCWATLCGQWQAVIHSIIAEKCGQGFVAGNHVDDHPGLISIPDTSYYK